MKKFLSVLMLLGGGLMLTGCFGGNESDEVKDYSLNLSEVESKLDSLNGGVFDRTFVDSDSMTEYSSPLEFIYDFTFEDIFNLKSDLVDISDTTIKYNSDSKELLAIIKPSASSEDDVKSVMNSFCESIDGCTSDTVDGYLIFVSSSDDASVIKKIKNSYVPIFNSMMTIEDDMLESIIGINPSDVSEHLIKTPSMMISSSTYLIVKPAEGSKDAVASLIDEYMTSLENQWETYLPDQYELVKNRLEKTYGDYLIYVISSDNDLVYSTIIGE